jgi:hypothetical protein
MSWSVRLSAALFVSAMLGACDPRTAPLRVDKVEPPEGITAGSDQVTITGQGFQSGKTQVEVRFGRHKSDQVAIVAGDKISVVTPAGDKGPVDVTVAFDNGAVFKIPNGFKYVNPQANADVRKAFLAKPTNAPAKQP